MAIFLLTPISNPDNLGQVVHTRFQNDAVQIHGTKSWLIAFGGTVIELSNQLGVTDGQNGTAVIVTVGSYYGRAPNDIWEWMKTRMERSNGPTI